MQPCNLMTSDNGTENSSLIMRNQSNTPGFLMSLCTCTLSSGLLGSFTFARATIKWRSATAHQQQLTPVTLYIDTPKKTLINGLNALPKDKPVNISR